MLNVELLTNRSLVCTAILMLAMTLLLVGGSMLSEAAMAADQAASQTGSPGLATAAGCTVVPRPVKDFRELPEDQPRMLGTPVTTPPPPTSGEPSTATEAGRINAATRGMIACTNAGDFRRIAALYTAEYFFRSSSGPGAEAFSAVIESLLQPRPLPSAEQIRLVSIQDVQATPDGRLTAVVPTNRSVTLLVFVEVGGTYLLDSSYELQSASTRTP